MTREDILKSAQDCVCGQRQIDYGTPEDNFSTIACLWSIYMKAAYSYIPLNMITAKDVAIMMALLKVARIARGSNPDSFIDLAGYAACAGEIVTKGDGDNE